MESSIAQVVLHPIDLTQFFNFKNCAILTEIIDHIKVFAAMIF